MRQVGGARTMVKRCRDRIIKSGCPTCGTTDPHKHSGELPHYGTQTAHSAKSQADAVCMLARAGQQPLVLQLPMRSGRKTKNPPGSTRNFMRANCARRYRRTKMSENKSTRSKKSERAHREWRELGA